MQNQPSPFFNPVGMAGRLPSNTQPHNRAGRAGKDLYGRPKSIGPGYNLMATRLGHTDYTSPVSGM